MHPDKVSRYHLEQLTDLPNIGPAMAKSLQLIGIKTPQQLAGKHPVALYESLCRVTGVRQDPCVLDVLISITRFMAGDAPQPWWHYTAERQRMSGVKYL